MTVTRQPDGRYAFVNNEGVIVSQHDTNAQAWRAADRAANEPISKREDSADWAWTKSVYSETMRCPASHRVSGHQGPGGAV